MTDQTNIPTSVDLRKYIDTHYFGERPHIRGRLIPVAQIAQYFHEIGWDVSTLAEEFTLSEEQVLAALLYYRENLDHINQQEVTEQLLQDEQYRKYSKS